MLAKGELMMNREILINHVAKTTRDMWNRGWAEANGGNVSLRLNDEQTEAFAGLQGQSEWTRRSKATPSLQGERFIFTGTGRYLRNVEIAPERNIGLVELNNTGTENAEGSLIIRHRIMLKKCESHVL
jgi:rhamnulose-1-phosphate aldolase